MIQKTTFSALKCLLLLAFSPMANAQIIYSNGDLSTGTTANNGTIAPAGYTWSECQSNTGSTTESNSNSGFSCAYNNAGTISLQLADNFTVPIGEQWSVTGFDVFAYQTGFTGTGLAHNQLKMQLFASDPSVTGATLIIGDMTTNILNVANSADALMYRIFNTTVPAPTATTTTRKIFRLRGDLAVTLTAGTYWLVYQAHATNDAATFVPPTTIVGSRGAAGSDSKQNIVASTAAGAILGWLSLADAGNPAAAPDVPQDMPFNVNGTITTLAVNSSELLNNFKMYPSPIKDICNFKLNSNIDLKANEVQVFDLQGRLILNKKLILANDSIISTNLTELNAGSYILKLNDADGKNIYTNKIIKE